jgi:hypothetical protein
MTEQTLLLSELEDETVNYIIGLSPSDKKAYFASLVATFYPTVERDSEEWQSLVSNYASSFYVEKLYRSNRFFQEWFTVVYTETGLIRDIVNDLYFLEESLITH